MKKFSLMLVSIFLVTLFVSCKEDVVSPATPAAAFTMSLEFKTRNEGLALARSLGVDPDEIDSTLLSNKLPFVAVFQISTKVSTVLDYDWYTHEASLFRSLLSGIQDDFQASSFMAGSWKKTPDGTYVHYGIILLDDSKFSIQSLPYKSLKDIQSDLTVSSLFEGILVSKRLKNSIPVTAIWKAKK